MTGGLAVYAPQLEHFDYVEVERVLAAFHERDWYSVASGFGLQGTMALYLFMRNPQAEIRVALPPDHTLVNPWWHAVPNADRVRLMPVRGNSQLAVATGVLKGCSELLAFCEFDEYLVESEEGVENAVSWRLVEKARRSRVTVATKVLKSKEDSSGFTSEKYL